MSKTNLCKYGPTCREKDTSCTKIHNINVECKNPNCDSPRCAFTHSIKTSIPKPKNQINVDAEPKVKTKSYVKYADTSSDINFREKNYKLTERVNELITENSELKEQIKKLKEKNSKLKEANNDLQEEIDLFTEAEESTPKKKSKLKK